MNYYLIYMFFVYQRKFKKRVKSPPAGWGWIKKPGSKFFENLVYFFGLTFGLAIAVLSSCYSKLDVILMAPLVV